MPPEEPRRHRRRYDSEDQHRPRTHRPRRDDKESQQDDERDERRRRRREERRRERSALSAPSASATTSTPLSLDSLAKLNKANQRSSQLSEHESEHRRSDRKHRRERRGHIVVEVDEYDYAEPHPQKRRKKRPKLHEIEDEGLITHTRHDGTKRKKRRRDVSGALLEEGSGSRLRGIRGGRSHFSDYDEKRYTTDDTTIWKKHKKKCRSSDRVVAVANYQLMRAQGYCLLSSSSY